MAAITNKNHRRKPRWPNRRATAIAYYGILISFGARFKSATNLYQINIDVGGKPNLVSVADVSHAAFVSFPPRMRTACGTIIIDR